MCKIPSGSTCYPHSSAVFPPELVKAGKNGSSLLALRAAPIKVPVKLMPTKS